MTLNTQPPQQQHDDNPATTGEETYLSPREAADLTGLKYREVFQLARQGKIRSRRDEAGNLHVSRTDVLAHTPQPFTPTVSPIPGDVLQERYRLDSILGKPGGYGKVFKAFNQELNGWRAIKHLTYLPGIDLFKREGQLLERLNHPGLPKVYDLFAEKGNYYLVMEYIQGETLSKWATESEPLAEQQVLQWAGQILDALDYLHQHDIIHRDVKPDNIVIKEDTAQAVLVDLGIAHTGDHTNPGGDSMFYSPPEQNEADIDNRADIYSLGATLYVLLTGKTLPTATVRANGEGVLPLCDHNPAISHNTEAVILKALSLNREGRWPTAQAMLDALRGELPVIATAVTS